MRPTILLCLWSFCGCLLLDLCKCSHQCGPHEFTVVSEDGSFKTCLSCLKCHEGYGLYPRCGETIKHPPMVECKPCVDGKNFSEAYDSSMCKTCQSCANNEVVAQKCTRSSDTNCSGTCGQGYFFSKAQDCQKCSYCCFDGKDQRQPECISKELNGNQQCSPRLDHTCGPDPTATATPATTNQQHGKIALILSGVGCGLLLVVLVLGAIYWQRRKKIKRRTRGMNTNGLNTSNGTLEVNVTQIPQRQDSQTAQRRNVHVPGSQILVGLNAGFEGNNSTPQRSNQATPCHTDDELPELPDVNTKRPKRLVKRQNSKEEQKASDSVRAIPQISNEGEPATSGIDDTESGGAEAGQERRRSRSGSLQNAITLVRKWSGTLNNPAYQSLLGEDPDGPPGPSQSVMIIEHPKTQTQREDSRVELKCRVKGGQEVNYQWFKDEAELPGEKSSILIFDPVRVPDFGLYKCAVTISCDTDQSNPRRLTSDVAELDVTPRGGRRYSKLSEVFEKDVETREKVEELLLGEIAGRKTWREVAKRYNCNHAELESIKRSEEPGVEVVKYLETSKPHLTVYDFCKTLKEIRRLDIVDKLSGHLCCDSSCSFGTA